MRKPQKRRLICSCCGAAFYGVVDPSWDQDRGYGFCPSCVVWKKEREEREWQKLTGQVAEAMNETNRGKFLAMDMELQRGLMLKMMDDGIIHY
jgi:hypothetical protein